jgi:predicted nucleic acid-binding protein
VVRQTCRPTLTTTYMETKNNPIIADTSALVSLINASDSNHALAVKEARRLLSADRPIMLPGDVFSETINILGKKFGHDVATQAGQKFLNYEGVFFVVKTDLDDLHEALKMFASQKQSVSFTDCVVMAVADTYGTKDIFGFDKQFEDAGYNRLSSALKSAA